MEFGEVEVSLLQALQRLACSSIAELAAAVVPDCELLEVDGERCLSTDWRLLAETSATSAANTADLDP